MIWQNKFCQLCRPLWGWLANHSCGMCEEELLYYLFTAIGLSPGGSGYFTCIQNMKLVTTKFKSGGLHEKYVVATWNLGNHLSICFWAQGNQEKPVSSWPVAGPSEYWPVASSPAVLSSDFFGLREWEMWLSSGRWLSAVKLRWKWIALGGLTIILCLMTAWESLLFSFF